MQHDHEVYARGCMISSVPVAKMAGSIRQALNEHVSDFPSMRQLS